LLAVRVTVVGDEIASIETVIRESAARAAVVVCTGGLGPTSDDLTRNAAAAAFGVDLEESAEAMEQIRERYRSRSRPMPELNRVQALVPRGATLLENPLGTAPGFVWDSGSCLLFFLPGVPFEMRPMLVLQVIPTLRERFALPPRRTVLLRCVSLAESVAGSRMEGFERPGVTVGYRASFPEVQVKLHVEAGLDATALAEEARARLGAHHVFGIDSGPLAAVVGNLLRERGQTVATAESCTAGRIAADLTAAAGSSAFLVGGVVAYSNSVKVELCDVPAELIERDGAVSESVARALAEGVRRRMRSHWGLAVTGVAGPGGGSAEKPVGTVHFACAGPDGTLHEQVRLPYDRLRNLAVSVALALDLLRQGLLRTT
jgi:nicotinamide-nucleotide amidase